MNLTRFDLKNQALLERIAVALERLVVTVEALTKEYRDLASVINPPPEVK